jgi:hypothetical protein
MALVGHQTEAIYQRYAIVAEQDLKDGTAKLAALEATTTKSPKRPKVIDLKSR